MSKATKQQRRSVTVIGLGNWGHSLTHALRKATIPLNEVIVRIARRRSGGTGLPLTTLARARLQSDIVWLCVPDAAIARVTRQLVLHCKRQGIALDDKIVIHSSGALDVGVLRAAADAGAATASVHPLMSFPTTAAVSLLRVPFGIEANAATRRILAALVRRMGGRPFAIDSAGKALYHVAGMLASPLLVSHLAATEQVAALAGFTPEQIKKLIEPIARATMDNFFNKGAPNSFSGPLARGDNSTIRLHLDALQPHPMLADIYRALAVYALATLPGRQKKQTRRALH